MTHAPCGRRGRLLDGVPLAPGRAYGRLQLGPKPGRFSVAAVETGSAPRRGARGVAGLIVTCAAPLAHEVRRAVSPGVPAVVLPRSRLSERRALLVEVEGLPRALRVATGEPIALDGGAGWVWLPGGSSAAARRRARRAAAALAAFMARPGPSRSAALRRALDAAGESMWRFALEALVRSPEAPPAHLLRVLSSELRPDSAAHRLVQSLAEGVRREAQQALDAGRAARRRRDLRDIEAARERLDFAHRVLRRLAVLTGEAKDLLEILLRERRALHEGGRRRLATLRDRLRRALALPEAALLRKSRSVEQLLEEARASHARLPRRKLEQRLERARARQGRALLVSFSAAHASPWFVGGKAAWLAQAQRALPRDVSVPAGFVVTTRAYRRHVRPLATELARVLRHGDPAQASRRARALLLGRPLEPALRARLAEAIRSLGGGPFAVRSSSVLEGNLGAPLDGILDSYLGVRGWEALQRAVRDVWASGWSRFALEAYAQHGVRPERVDHAVLVQPAVATQVAGVMQVGPSPEQDRVVINAWWGLGEAVARAEVQGDVLVLETATGRTLSYATGSDRIYVALGPAGPEDRPLPQSWRGKRCLGPRRRLALARLAGALARAGWGPCAVEFGVARGGKLWLFQVRPLR